MEAELWHNTGIWAIKKTPAEVYQASRQPLRSAPASPPLRKETELNETLQLTP